MLRSEVFTAVNVLILILWVATLCSHVDDYQCFGGPCCLCLEGISEWSWDVGGFIEEWWRDQAEGNIDWPLKTQDGEVGLYSCLGQ
jgi:hypothetical protein